MQNNDRQPVLSFEYASTDGRIIPRTFRNPVKVIQAEHVDDVIPALRNVQEAVDAGWYAAGFLSYEAAPAFDPAYRVNEGQTMPLLWFGIFGNRNTVPFARPARSMFPIGSRTPGSGNTGRPSGPSNRRSSTEKPIRQIIQSGSTVISWEMILRCLSA
jgi:hypothetical protein